MYLARATGVIILFLLATLGTTADAGDRRAGFQRGVPAWAFQPAQRSLWRIGGTQFLLTDGANYFFQDQWGRVNQVFYPIPQWLWADMKTALQLQPVNGPDGQPMPNVFSNGQGYIYKTPEGFQSLRLWRILGKDGNPIPGLWGDGVNLWWNVPDKGLRQVFFDENNRAVWSDRNPVNDKVIAGLRKYWGEDYPEYFANNQWVQGFLNNAKPTQTPATGSESVPSPPNPGVTGEGDLAKVDTKGSTEVSPARPDVTKAPAPPAPPADETVPPPLPSESKPEGESGSAPAPTPIRETLAAGCAIILAGNNSSTALAAAIGLKRKDYAVKLFVSGEPTDKSKAALKADKIDYTDIGKEGKSHPEEIKNYFASAGENLKNCKSIEVISRASHLDEEKALIEGLSALPSTMKINFISTNADERTIESLAAKLPNACVVGAEGANVMPMFSCDETSAGLDPNAAASTFETLISRYYAKDAESLKPLWDEPSCVSLAAKSVTAELANGSIYDAFWAGRKKDRNMYNPLLSTFYHVPREDRSLATYLADGHLAESLNTERRYTATSAQKAFEPIVSADGTKGPKILQLYQQYDEKMAAQVGITDPDARSTLQEEVRTLARDILELERELVETARTSPTGFKPENDPCQRKPEGGV